MQHEMKKVIWSEGMLLRNQLFQQQERYLEWKIHEHVCDGYENSWGFKSLRIADQYLPLMRLGLAQTSGILPDGTPFKIEAGDDYPVILNVPKDAHNKLVYLALPLQKADAAIMDMHPRGKTEGTRFSASKQNIRDNTTTDNASAPVNVGELKLQLLLESDDCNAFACMPFARIKQVTEEDGLILDEQFIPPALDCQTIPPLAGLAHEVYALLFHRAQTLSQRVAASNRGNIADISDFLLLQAINRATPLFAHFSEAKGLHPKTLYQHMMQLMGELATFMHPNKHLNDFPKYQHSNLSNTFTPIMSSLRNYLNRVLNQAAIDIPLVQNKSGVYVAAIHDNNLLNNSDFILAVRADMAEEEMHQKFVAQTKVSPIDKIQSLVTSQVSGLTLKRLSVAPPQIPYHAGFVYYVLDSNHRLWHQAKRSGGLALHMGGEFPNVELELWAIKK